MNDPHDGLTRRIRSRAENPETRTDVPPTTLGCTARSIGGRQTAATRSLSGLQEPGRSPHLSYSRGTTTSSGVRCALAACGYCLWGTALLTNTLTR
jgi:hypothetical protein